MSDSNNHIEVISKKRLMLPLSATYTLNNTNGFADGVIAVTVLSKRVLAAMDFLFMCTRIELFLGATILMQINGFHLLNFM